MKAGARPGHLQLANEPSKTDPREMPTPTPRDLPRNKRPLNKRPNHPNVNDPLSAVASRSSDKKDEIPRRANYDLSGEMTKGRRGRVDTGAEIDYDSFARSGGKNSRSAEKFESRKIGQPKAIGPGKSDHAVSEVGAHGLSLQPTADSRSLRYRDANAKYSPISFHPDDYDADRYVTVPEEPDDDKASHTTANAGNGKAVNYTARKPGNVRGTKSGASTPRGKARVSPVSKETSHQLKGGRGAADKPRNINYPGRKNSNASSNSGGGVEVGPKASFRYKRKLNPRVRKKPHQLLEKIDERASPEAAGGGAADQSLRQPKDRYSPGTDVTPQTGRAENGRGTEQQVTACPELAAVDPERTPVGQSEVADSGDEAIPAAESRNDQSKDVPEGGNQGGNKATSLKQEDIDGTPSVLQGNSTGDRDSQTQDNDSQGKVVEPVCHSQTSSPSHSEKNLPLSNLTVSPKPQALSRGESEVTAQLVTPTAERDSNGVSSLNTA